MLSYFKQNRPLLEAINHARENQDDFDALFDVLLKSRLTFALTGPPEDRASFEYLTHPDGLTLVAAYSDQWHARKSRQREINGHLEIDSPIIFDLAGEEAGVIVNPFHKENVILHPPAVRDLKSRYSEKP